jgi:RNA polymerase sigma-70 factor, ECF subfamily
METTAATATVTGSLTETLSLDCIKRHLAGDRRALDELIRFNAPMARRRVLRVVGDRADADDILQDVWLSVHRSASMYAGAGPFAAWLGAIIKATALMALRNQWRNTGPISHDEPSRDTPQDEALDNRRTIKRIRAALVSLTPSQRAAFLVGVIDGEPNEGGISTRRVHVNEARRKLRSVV